MKIAVLGYGVEGKSSERYFKLHSPDALVTIFDDFNDSQELDLAGFDLVVRSPSVNPNKLGAKNVTSGTKIFFDRCPAPIIGVTGTKGKGTTCSLIASVLRAAGRTVHLVGNIGAPALDELDKIKRDDIVVYELSSFQLWDLDKSPQTAVVLRIEPDHLDVHSDFDDYTSAKNNIAKYQAQGDMVVYYANNEYSRRAANLSVGKKLPYPSNGGAHISNGSFYFGEQIICSTGELALPGAHNQENALAAISAVWGVDGVDEEAIKEGLKIFTGLPHRLEFVRELGGVKYYDDNFSSSFPSLDVAVRAFPNDSIVLIAGGKDRGLENSEDIAKSILASTVKKAFLLGETASTIADFLSKEKFEVVESLQAAVEESSQIARDGDIVLMSPGAPSFDMFKNFTDRGEQFQKLVRGL